MPLSQLSPGDLNYGHPTPAGGKAMVSYILTAIELALEQTGGGHGHRAHQQGVSMNLAGYAIRATPSCWRRRPAPPRWP